MGDVGTGILTVRATETERAEGCLAPDRLEAAVAAVRRDSVVVVADAIDAAHVAALHDRMSADLDHIANRLSPNSANGHRHHGPPVGAPFVFADVIANPVVASIVSAAVMAPVQLNFYNGNTNLPGSLAQPLHRDHGNLWPSLDSSHPAAQLSLGITLTDTDASNGATEVWPGTHELAHLGAPGELGPELIEERRAIRPPLQVATPAGGVMIRDARAWHRGMPNPSARARMMLGMVLSADWLFSGALPFETSAKDVFADLAVKVRPYFVEAFDHLEDWRARAAREMAVRNA